MREVPLSTCEKDFILKAISQKKRIDGRQIYDYRRIKVSFGVDRGCCQVEIGKTRVMTQVSCHVTPPKQTRLTEGILFVNVELPPMASPRFEQGRMSEYGVEINRLLERCIKESRCVDTESLCIMAGVKVWTIRVDSHVLNHEGNLIDACSISAIAALAHFRRPDVTVQGEDVTIHSVEERDPIPLSVHHMPICVSFAFFDQGKYLLVDPSEREERVTDGKMIIAMNKHREICTLQVTGGMLLLHDQVLRCSNIAVVKVAEITELIQQALLADTQARSKGERFGFAVSVESKKVTAGFIEPGEVEPEETMEEELSEGEESSEQEEESNSVRQEEVKILGPGTAEIGSGGVNTWTISSSDTDDDDDDDDDDDEVSQVKIQQPTRPAPETIELSGDSEEEDIITLDKDHLGLPSTSKKQEIKEQTLDLLSALKKKPVTSKTNAKKKTKKKKAADEAWLNL